MCLFARPCVEPRWTGGATGQPIHSLSFVSLHVWNCGGRWPWSLNQRRVGCAATGVAGGGSIANVCVSGGGSGGGDGSSGLWG
jgi:hypothetical protein